MTYRSVCTRVVLLLFGISLVRAAAAQNHSTGDPPAGVSSPDPQNSGGSNADSKYGLDPGEDPDNHLILPFLKHIGSDQKQFWTYPAHLKIKDLKWIAPTVGITAGLIASDSWISHQIPNKPNQLDRSLKISDYSLYSMIGAGGGSYLLGEMTHNDHLSEAGLLSGEAAIDATGVTYAIKALTERQRPNVGNGDGSFFAGGQSFPSEHSTIAWAIASVWAHEYPSTLSQILAYGLASTVTLTRVTAQQHFASDVVIGGALGWYFGREVYRSHHDETLGGAAWGDLFPEDTGERTRDPKNMGSPYVPLDSWVYPVIERLAAMGYINSAFLGMRPWTRLECARLLGEAQDHLTDEPDEEDGHAGKLIDALETEFEPETARLGGAENLGASLDSIYTRTTGISGTPLRDGYHFGQTIINDYGRPYGEGFNNVSGFTSHAEAGPFSISVQGEYQHAPAVASDPLSVLQATAAADFTPPLANGSPTINRFRLISGIVSFKVNDVQFSFGEQNQWLGPGEAGALLMSDNAEPFPMLKIDTPAAYYIPFVSRILGPVRSEYFIGQLSGHRWEECDLPTCSTYPGFQGIVGPDISPQPFIHGEKISFKPTQNLEFGMGITAMFGGPGLPVTLRNYFRTYYVHSTVAATNPGKRISAFDFTYRVPGLRNWLTFYMDSLVVDEISPIGSSRPTVNPGIYLPQIPKIPKMEFRIEALRTTHTNEFPPGFVYFDQRRFRDGYTNNGNLMGNWVGRDGQGGQAWLTYSLTPYSKLQFQYRNQETQRDFVGGGHLNDYALRGDFMVRSHFAFSGFLQYEEWRFPVLSPANQNDVAASLQLTFFPHWGFKK
ncbi:MAG: capsule assembly Wzi family protein [Terriglobales bacterium]